MKYVCSGTAHTYLIQCSPSIFAFVLFDCLIQHFILHWNLSSIQFETYIYDASAAVEIIIHDCRKNARDDSFCEFKGWRELTQILLQEAVVAVGDMKMQALHCKDRNYLVVEKNCSINTLPCKQDFNTLSYVTWSKKNISSNVTDAQHWNTAKSLLSHP